MKACCWPTQNDIACSGGLVSAHEGGFCRKPPKPRKGSQNLLGRVLKTVLIRGVLVISPILAGPGSLSLSVALDELPLAPFFPKGAGSNSLLKALSPGNSLLLQKALLDARFQAVDGAAPFSSFHLRGKAKVPPTSSATDGLKFLPWLFVSVRGCL